MNAAGLMVSAFLYLPVMVLAEDSAVELTLEGRPVDAGDSVAVLHAGRIYADAVDLTKCFDGFITLRRGGSATITIGPNTGTFAPGSRAATINDVSVGLADAPFMRNGELYVPLEEFVVKIAAAMVSVSPGRRHADIRVNGSPH